MQIHLKERVIARRGCDVNEDNPYIEVAAQLKEIVIAFKN